LATIERTFLMQQSRQAVTICMMMSENNNVTMLISTNATVGLYSVDSMMHE